MSKTNAGAAGKLEKLNQKVKSFSDLLDGINALEDRKKLLWKEVYENAISDREAASTLYTELYINLNGGTQDHVAAGSIMTKYLERMCKSNEQILKLAELISREETKASKIDAEDMFTAINGG
ncbi:MAG: hypothetical protein CMA72_09520 [Euryarchaeota archaeon]|nr:hypothetical protein [Euryarchaeota archaeon]|tara:strand:- start:10096 stop:10464 length:369 start_codon:yes stop_codon:yes gene_type:complete